MFDISLSLSPTKTEFGPLLFSGNLNKGIMYAHKLGYDGVEISLINSFEIDYKAIINQLNSLNMIVSTIATGQSYYDEDISLYNLIEHKRMEAVERIKGHIDLAKHLNCMVIIGGIRGRLEGRIVNKSWLEKKGLMALKECINYAKKKKVIILIEPINRYETNIVNTIKDGIELIEYFGFDNLKLLPDIFHMNIEEKSIIHSLEEAGKLIGHIHFSDNNRLAPGLGHINYYELLKALIKVDYKAGIGMEILPKPSDLIAAKKAINNVKFMINNLYK